MIAATRVRAYPQFARVNFWQATADNNYRALLLKFERRFSGRYQYRASYTLSKSEDDSFQNVYGDRYGFFKEIYPGQADRRAESLHPKTRENVTDLEARNIGPDDLDAIGADAAERQHDRQRRVAQLVTATDE